jgi:excisionase family DNA binding protein
VKRIKAKHLEKSVGAIPAERTDTMLTPGDVARILNVHTNTVRRWSSLGILRGFRIGPRGDRRFLKQDVDKFLRK